MQFKINITQESPGRGCDLLSSSETLQWGVPEEMWHASDVNG